MSFGSLPDRPDRKAEERTTSSVVTPKRLRSVSDVISHEPSMPMEAMTANAAVYTLTHRFGSYTPAFLKTSATIGTVELTGLAMMSRCAFGATLAAALARSRTIEALVWRRDQPCTQEGPDNSTSSTKAPWLSSKRKPSRSQQRTLNRSSRVMPGLRGTPAGMRMMSAPSRDFSRPLFSGE